MGNRGSARAAARMPAAPAATPPHVTPVHRHGQPRVCANACRSAFDPVDPKPRRPQPCASASAHNRAEQEEPPTKGVSSGTATTAGHRIRHARGTRSAPRAECSARGRAGADLTDIGDVAAAAGAGRLAGLGDARVDASVTRRAEAVGAELAGLADDAALSATATGLHRRRGDALVVAAAARAVRRPARRLASARDALPVLRGAVGAHAAVEAARVRHVARATDAVLTAAAAVGAGGSGVDHLARVCHAGTAAADFGRRARRAGRAVEATARRRALTLRVAAATGARGGPARRRAATGEADDGERCSDQEDGDDAGHRANEPVLPPVVKEKSKTQ